MAGSVASRSDELEATSSRGLQSGDSGGILLWTVSRGLGKHTRGTAMPRQDGLGIRVSAMTS